MMNLRRTACFDANFTELDSQSQKAIRKALRFLVNDLDLLIVILLNLKFKKITPNMI